MSAGPVLCDRLSAVGIPEDATARKYSLARKLWWLIFGRLAVAIFIGLVRVIWISGRHDEAWTQALPALLIVCGLTVVYSLAHRVSRTLPFQARLQFALDIILVTWLNWTTDVIHSPYIALYIVIIAAASLFLGPRDAIVTSLGCAVAFTASALAVLAGYGTHSPRLLDVGSSQTIQTVGLFDLAFLVVGLLSARLAERQSRSDVRLIAATQSLASLRALHERIVESIRSGVVTTDLEGRIYTSNAAAEEITGYKAAELRGQDVSILFGNLDSMEEESLKAAAEGIPTPRFEAECLTSEGLPLMLGFSIFPLFDELRQTTGLVITFQDLTRMRSLEASSRRQDRLAAVGRVAASIAHEIRNPLAAMRGSIQVLRSEIGDDSTQAQSMEIILRESDRLNKIITDYLTYARPRAHSLVNVDLNELLSETFTLLRHDPSIKENHILETTLPDHPVMVNADPS